MADTDDRFDARLAFVLGHEGGFNDVAGDRGGATNLGISLRYARSKGRVLDLDRDGDVDADDIRLITRAEAARLYRADFWDATRCGELPAPLDLLVFDAAVNCGAPRAVQWLQAAAGAAEDGRFGPRTMAAVGRRLAQPGGLAALSREVMARRISHHASLDDMPQFRLGWSRRLADLAFTSSRELA